MILRLEGHHNLKNCAQLLPNTSKIIVMKQQQNNFTAGGHHNVRNGIKGSPR